MKSGVINVCEKHFILLNGFEGWVVMLDKQIETIELPNND